MAEGVTDYGSRSNRLWQRLELRKEGCSKPVLGVGEPL